VTSAISSLTPPDSPICRKAELLLQEVLPRQLRNHSYRTFYLGELVGDRNGVCCDRELLYLSSLLHDLGLTDKYDGDLRFEVRGADAAREFVKAHGLSDDKAETLWDAIALHTAPGIADRKGPEAALVQLGAACDIMGVAYEQVGAAQVDAVIAEFPREGIQKYFLEQILREVMDHPTAVSATWMADVGRQSLPEVGCPTWADQIRASPYSG